MKIAIKIKSGEQVDDLQYNGLKIIQKKSGFRFGADACLLADFARAGIRKNDKVADLGTGTGIIPVLLAAKTRAAVIKGLEIQEDIAEMAARSVLLNDLGDRVEIICGDIRQSVSLLGKSIFNAVVSNPPYIKNECGIKCAFDEMAIARQEIACSLEDVVRNASLLLKEGGAFYLVHKPLRLADIICLMRKYRLEPKLMRFVQPFPSKKANLVMLKGVKGGNPELRIIEPLYMYNEDGSYSEEINKIYSRAWHR